MKILVAEYASAIGLGGTCELEGQGHALHPRGELRAERPQCGLCHPRAQDQGGRIYSGERPAEFEVLLETIKADACLLIAPDGLQPRFLEIIEGHTANLGSTPGAARVAADKRLCTQALARAGVPVAEIVDKPDPVEKGCHLYRCEAAKQAAVGGGVRITSFVKAGPDEIVTRYHEGLHLSASFIVGREGFLPLTIFRQLINFEGEGINYQGSQVPYITPGRTRSGRRQGRRLRP